ncbi:MAG: iron-sulfur cluster assembly scaffold protein [Pseudomonadota bacterium]
MLDNVYNSKILEYAGNIDHVGELEKPDAKARAHSKLCGSTVDVSLKLDGDVVSDFAHKVKACALGQASSSIMARKIIGSTSTELRQLRHTMYAMLKENGPAPEGKFEDFRFLEPVRDYKARHASTLLTFDAVVDCLDQIENAREAAE